MHVGYSHVGKLVVDLAVHEGSLVAGKRCLQALFNEDTDCVDC